VARTSAWRAQNMVPLVGFFCTLSAPKLLHGQEATMSPFLVSEQKPDPGKHSKTRAGKEDDMILKGSHDAVCRIDTSAPLVWNRAVRSIMTFVVLICLFIDVIYILLGLRYEIDAKAFCVDLGAGACAPAWSRGASGTSGSTGGASGGSAGSAVARAAGVGTELALATCARYSTAFVASLDRRAHAPEDLGKTARRGSRSSRNSILLSSQFWPMWS